MAGINFSSMDMNNIPSPTGSNMILSFHSNGHLSKKDSNGNITRKSMGNLQYRRDE